MSVPKRKIGFYTLKLVDKKDSKKTYPPTGLKPVFDKIVAIPKQQRIYALAESHRFHFLDGVGSDVDISQLLFKSAKYHHRPPLIDLTATERDNPKKLNEGESEATHVSIKFLDQEAILLLEERRAGISLKTLVYYLNRFAHQLAEKEKQKIPWYIVDGVIPKGDFLSELRKMKRAQLGLVHIEKQILGDECLNFSNRIEESQNDLILSIRAKRKHSLQSLMADVYKLFIAKKQHVTKIRVYGYTLNENPVLLDTDMVKQIEYAEVDLNSETGVVDSAHLFEKFRVFLENFG